MKKTLIAATIACLAAGTAPTIAHEAGDVIVRAGIVSVNPDASSDPVVLPTVTLPNGVDVDSNEQISLTLTYMFNQNFGLGVLAATPFEHDITVEDAPGLKAGSTKHLPPTVTLQWFPMGGTGQNFQPYLGAGINYTTFFSEDTTSAFNDTVGSLLGVGGPVRTTLSLDDSFGLGLEAGFDLAINEKWMVNFAVWYLDIGTTADVGVPDLGATVSFDVDIDPWVYSLNIGYRF